MTIPQTSSLKSSGFTLVEAMVAISILALAVGAPLYAANRALVSAQNSRNQLTALYLAQEGVEHLRLIRDNDFLVVRALNGLTVSTDAWNYFLNGGGPAGTQSINQCRSADGSIYCRLDPWANTLQACTMGASGTCTALLLDTSNGSSGGQYSQSSGTAQPYTRTVQVVDIPGTSDTPTPYPDKEVISTVSWSFHGAPYSVVVTDHLTPWQ